MAANTNQLKVTLPTDTTIRLEREFNAPRHLVFEAMTKPEYVKQWWGPRDTTLSCYDHQELSFSQLVSALNPERSALYTYSSRSNVVRTSTRVRSSVGSAQISLVASSPSRTGIRTSISTTCGNVRRARSRASRPLVT